MLKVRPIRSARGSDAFTLVEMSVVLVIIGLIVGALFPALAVLRQDAQRVRTTTNMEALMRTTAAFVHANGCLPCPTPAGTSGAGFGYVRGAAAGSPACGDCAVAEGVVPFASLGVPSAMAKDGWGRWFTMRIDPYLARNFGVTPPSGANGFCEGNASTLAGAVPVLVSAGKAAVLFLSHGPNGKGSFFRSGPVNVGQTNAHPAYVCLAATCTANENFEKENADGDSAFTDAPQGDGYDDLMTFLGRDALVALIGTSVCTAAW